MKLFQGEIQGLVDVSDIFYFFPLGEGEGESEAPGRGGGGRFLLKFPGVGGRSLGGGGAEGRGRCLRRIGEFFGGGD